MSYTEYLQNMDGCIFCEYPDEYIIEKGRHFYVLMANAPYAKDHMLIVSYRHFGFFSELTAEEYVALGHYINKVSTFLYSLEHNEVSLFVRDGQVGSSTGKSITHFHYHVLPSVDVRGVAIDPHNRPFYDKAKHLAISKTMKKKWDKFFG